MPQEKQDSFVVHVSALKPLQGSKVQGRVTFSFALMYILNHLTYPISCEAELDIRG